LAAIAPLTMLPVHHHLYDTKLLLLTVPACALLWSGKGSVAWLALAVNLAVFVATGDVSWTVLYRFIDNLHPSARDCRHGHCRPCRPFRFRSFCSS
jgi:hypothetical protein